MIAALQALHAVQLCSTSAVGPWPAMHHVYPCAMPALMYSTCTDTAMCRLPRHAAFDECRCGARPSAREEAQGEVPCIVQMLVRHQHPSHTGAHAPHPHSVQCALHLSSKGLHACIVTRHVAVGSHQGAAFQLDPKAIARERAKIAKTEAKAQQRAKEASTNHKLTGFFRPLQARN